MLTPRNTHKINRSHLCCRRIGNGITNENIGTQTLQLLGLFLYCIERRNHRHGFQISKNTQSTNLVINQMFVTPCC